MEYYDDSTGLGYTEQLYTARGAQGAGVYHKTTDKAGVNPADYTSLLLHIVHYYNDLTVYYQTRALWTTKRK